MGGPGFQDPGQDEDPPGGSPAWLSWDWMTDEEREACAAALAAADPDDLDPDEEELPDEAFLSPEEREAVPVITGGWFASGGRFDAAPGGAALAGFADAAAGDDDSY